MLLNRLTTRAGISVWSKLKEKFNNFEPETAITNFEKFVHKSLQQFFPNIKVYGSFFSYLEVIKFKK